jgi:hypothetical protein
VEFQRLARFLPRNAIAKMTPEEIEAVKTVLPMTRVRGEFGVATRLGFRIALPMFDAEGIMKSLRLRRMNLAKDKYGKAKLRKEKKSEPKELGIKGAARGLVLANGPALELLRGRGQRPYSWGERELTVVIAEGVPDFLVASYEPDEAVRAIFGICGPSCWSLDMAARIPYLQLIRSGPRSVRGRKVRRGSLAAAPPGLKVKDRRGSLAAPPQVRWLGQA